ncbi:MAG: HNH endonuclease [Planctomycetaceae bacterium]|nr:HNH endonuclease [Planctomycetaceae bacterium]
MKQFYADNQIKDGDELVLQRFDNDTFRLMPETTFSRQYQQSISLLETCQDDETVQQTLKETEKLVNISADKILENEFIKLANVSGAPERKIKETKSISKRENVPLYLRRILQSVYEGKCQITQFTFLMKNGNPYFEIHHIIPEWGNHIKNLLVVCPNIHAQFTHTNTVPYFDQEDGWLRQVSFNGTLYNVFQKIDVLHKTFTKEVHY